MLCQISETIKVKNNITELVFNTDRSGSMAGLENDTMGGFNSLLKKQKKQRGECDMHLQKCLTFGVHIIFDFYLPAYRKFGCVIVQDIQQRENIIFISVKTVR